MNSGEVRDATRERFAVSIVVKSRTGRAQATRRQPESTSGIIPYQMPTPTPTLGPYT
jgi:hypothetical protein